MSFPSYEQLVGHILADLYGDGTYDGDGNYVGGASLSHRHWMANVGANLDSTLTAAVHLDTAALLAIHSSPVQVVAAPGAGKALLVTGGLLQTKATQGLVAMDGLFTLYYGGDALDLSTIDTARGRKAASDLGGPLYFGTATCPLIPVANNDSWTILENAPLVLAATDRTVEGGPIATMSIANAGAGYSVDNVIGQVTNDWFQGHAGVRIDAVDVDGAVTAFTMTDPADGYSVEDSPYAVGNLSTSSTGGFQVNVDSIVGTDQEFWLDLTYQVITLH